MLQGIYGFDEVADMYVLTPPDGTMFMANGFTTRQDQPPILYFYNGSSTATPDGVNVICPTAITPPAPGRYVKIPFDYKNLLNQLVLATVATSGSYADLIGKPTLATVATTGSYTDLINLPPARSASIPTRSLNSAAYQISATRDALALYSVQIAATISLTTGQSGTVSLQMSSTSGGTYATVNSCSNGNTGSLTLGLNITQTQLTVLAAFVPAGYYVKLVSSGTATNTMVAQQEVLL